MKKISLSYKDFKKGLKELNIEEITEFTDVMYKKYVLEEDNLDYTKLSDATVGFICLTIGVNYNNMHPTKESREKEDSTEWFKKIGAIPQEK